MSAIEDIAAERRRQIEAEGWTPEHDDGHDNGEMALAAACYASPIKLYMQSVRARQVIFDDPYPWDDNWDKRVYDGNTIRPNENIVYELRRKLLVQSGALIAAEIERLDREHERNQAATREFIAKQYPPSEQGSASL